ncbi:MAG: metal ABC transporter permease [Thermodesulfobacteriota bacterium]
MWIFTELFPDYTVAVVVCGSVLLGIAAGVCGTVVFVRKENLLSDAVSHGCLPGIVLGFIIAGAKHPSALLLGGFVSAFLTVGFVRLARSSVSVKFDSALALGVSISFGIGIVLLTSVQSGGAAGQAGLDRFLFGQASAMSSGDVKTIFFTGAVCSGALAVFWKQVKIFCFDSEYAVSAGFRTRAAGFFLNTVLVSTIVVGIETVGVILMCSMLVAPAVAARHLTDKLGMMVTAAAVTGALGGAAGSLASWKIAKLPTGPAIVICVTAAALLSMLFSRKNGLLARSSHGGGGERE